MVEECSKDESAKSPRNGGPARKNSKESGKSIDPSKKSITPASRIPSPMPECFATSKTPHLRILAYGDSLTAGYYANGKRFQPYAKAFAQSLLPDVTTEVWVCGLSGLTAEEMVERIDEENIPDAARRTGKGILKILKEKGQFDMALIMAGTNDLAYGHSPKDILDNIQQLHTACHRQSTKTFALAVPPSGGSTLNKKFGKLHGDLNSALKAWADGQQDVLSFVDTREIVPFVLDSELWEEDGLHFSPSGSDLLGIEVAARLKPLMQQVSCRGQTAERSCKSDLIEL